MAVVAGAEGGADEGGGAGGTVAGSVTGDETGEVGKSDCVGALTGVAPQEMTMAASKTAAAGKTYF
jgi:hypothetical protein